MREAKCRCRI